MSGSGIILKNLKNIGLWKKDMSLQWKAAGEKGEHKKVNFVENCRNNKTEIYI